MINCTIVDNESTSGGTIYLSDGVPATIKNSIIAFNTNGSAFCSKISPDISIICTDIFGHAGGDWTGFLAPFATSSGNFNLDPAFCDHDNGDYSINKSSPCGPTHNDCGVYIGAFRFGCPNYLCGDANNDNARGVSDAVWIMNYIFVGGSPPNPYGSGDCNCDDLVNISDTVWLINYVFTNGNEPCDTDGDSVPDC